VQETFVSALHSLSSFRYGSSHLPWLYRIGTNVCLKNIRQRKRYASERPDSGDLRPSPAADPVARLDARRLLERLQDEMDERDLEILVSHYISGMDQGEIAASLGISRRAVVKRLTLLRGRVGHLWKEVNVDA